MLLPGIMRSCHEHQNLDTDSEFLHNFYSAMTIRFLVHSKFVVTFIKPGGTGNENNNTS
jgi:hypothetical protein